MRVFVSLGLPSGVKKELVKIQERIRASGLIKGKFVEEENLHLTLKFLGEVSEADVDKVRENLRKISFKGFSAGLGEIGVFSEKFVRIIWAHLKGADELQKKIDFALKEMFEPERRFMSHITLVRVKRVEDKKRLLNFLKEIKIENKNFYVDRFYLMKSELSPEGPKYGILGEFLAS